MNLGSGDPVHGTLARTSKGVLAMVRQGGRLPGVSLTAGKLLWYRAYAHQEDSDGPVASVTWVLTPTDLVYFMSNSLYGAPQPGVTEVVDRRLATGAVRWSVRLPLWSAGADAVVRPSGPDVLVTSFAGGPAEVLAIDVATGHTRAVTRPPQIPPAPVVTGGDALLAVYSPPCAFAVAATDRLPA